MSQKAYIIFFLVVFFPVSAGAAASRGQPCGIENCHGLEITCGPDVPQVCTEIYQLGDFCREHARCEVVEGVCQFVTDGRFLSCKACVEACSGRSGPDAFDCEAACRDTVDGREEASQSSE